MGSKLEHQPALKAGRPRPSVFWFTAKCSPRCIARTHKLFLPRHNALCLTPAWKLQKTTAAPKRVTLSPGHTHDDHRRTHWGHNGTNFKENHTQNHCAAAATPQQTRENAHTDTHTLPRHVGNVQTDLFYQNHFSWLGFYFWFGHTGAASGNTKPGSSKLLQKTLFATLVCDDAF